MRGAGFVGCVSATGAGAESIGAGSGIGAGEYAAAPCATSASGASPIATSGTSPPSMGSRPSSSRSSFRVTTPIST